MQVSGPYEQLAVVAQARFDQISDTHPSVPRAVRALTLKQRVTPGGTV